MVECDCKSSALPIKCKAYGKRKNSKEKIRFFDDQMNFEFAFRKILVCGGSYGIFESFNGIGGIHLFQLMEKYMETKKVEFLESCKAMSKNHHLMMSEQESTKWLSIIKNIWAARNENSADLAEFRYVFGALANSTIEMMSKGRMVVDKNQVLGLSDFLDEHAQEIKVGHVEFEDQLNFARRKRGLVLTTLRAESLELSKGCPICMGRQRAAL